MNKYILTILALLLSICVLPAQGYTVDKFHVEIDVTDKGELDIKETIEVNFTEESRGIFREIPYKYNHNGKKFTTPMSKFKIPNHKNVITNSGGNKRIRIGDPDVYLTGKQIYEIYYTVDKTIIEYEDGQELYWNLTGDDWDTSIDNLTYEVRLPKSVDLRDDYIKISVGKYGSELADGNYEFDGKVLKGFVASKLKSGEEATVAMNLPIGYFDGISKAESMQSYGIDKEKNKPWYLAIPLALLGLIWAWWKSRRNANKLKMAVENKYYPPEGLTSAHVGAYIDHKVQKRDVISLIPYWATEGFIKVRGLEDGDMQLVKLKDLPADFPGYEHEFFNAIFEKGNVISFSEAQHQFGPSYYKVSSSLVKEIENAGYYDPGYVWLFKSWRWPVICALIVIAGIMVLVNTAYLIFGIGLIIIGIFCIGFSFFTAPLSEYGQQVHDHLVGLSQFLKDAPEDDIRRLSAEDENYFSHMLPYAVAFGYDKQWITKYEKVSTVSPSWYEVMYYGSFIRPDFGVFRKGFEVKEITEAFTTFPKPAFSSDGGSFSGGGFSSGGGGGFSGGGFGGGGGGRW